MSEGYTVSRESHDELVELTEDVVENVCNNHLMSGQAAWTILSALSESKLQQLSGNIS